MSAAERIFASSNLLGSGTQYHTLGKPGRPWTLRDGGQIPGAVIAYETWGTLNRARSNAILVFHALSGSHHAAGFDPHGPRTPLWTDECHDGWWDAFIGPGRAFDTDEYFVIAANFLGGCYGSTGPASVDPRIGQPFGGAFPWPTIADIVDSQVSLLGELGIGQLAAVAGGSLGGFCSMDFAIRYPERTRLVIPIASGLRATTLAKVLNFEQIVAIERDPAFRGGNYYGTPGPRDGLALARMISHKTFVSLDAMNQRARQDVEQPVTSGGSGYRWRHHIESYMAHQGRKFVDRFDANSYLRIVNAWQSFDIPEEYGGGDPAAAFVNCRGQEWLLFSIDSDVCFYPEEQSEIAAALTRAGVNHQYLTVHSTKGHDAFLLEPDSFAAPIRWRLETLAR